MVCLPQRLTSRATTALHYAVVMALLASAARAEAQDCQGVPLRNATVRLHVQATVLATGAVREKFGSGVIVSKFGHVLTNNHVVSAGADTGDLKILGAIGSKAAQHSSLQLLAQNEYQDLALLQFEDDSITYTAAPVGDSWGLSNGAKLCSGGFPLPSDYFVTEGVLGSKSGPKGWWVSSITTNEGESGAPVFDQSRELVGVKVGGFSAANSMNLIIPISMANTLLKLTPVTAEPGQNKSAPPPPSAVAPPECPVNETRESTGGIAPSSGEYSVVCKASTGYRITKWDLVRTSENNLSDVRFTPTPDGSQVVMSFRLTSGPIYDRWRGWLHGSLVVQQEKR